MPDPAIRWTSSMAATAATTRQWKAAIASRSVASSARISARKASAVVFSSTRKASAVVFSSTRKASAVVFISARRASAVVFISARKASAVVFISARKASLLAWSSDRRVLVDSSRSALLASVPVVASAKASATASACSRLKRASSSFRASFRVSINALLLAGTLPDSSQPDKSAASSPLERAGGQALDEVTLDEGEEDAGRNQREHARGHHLPPVDRELGDEGQQPDGEGHVLLAVDQHQREQQLRPGGGEYEPERRAHAGQGQREDYVTERLAARAAVDHRRFLELLGDAVEERLHEEGGERRVERGVGDDQAEQVVGQAKRGHQPVDRRNH